MNLTSDPDVVLASGGRLVVFVRGADNAIWHRWQHGAGGGWADWTKLGKDNDSVGGPSATVTGNLGLVVFIRGTDNAIWHRWQSAPDSNWSEWVSLGGTLTSDPDAIVTWDSKLVVFARGTDNAIWYRRQATPFGYWLDWEKLGAVNDSVGGPSATITATGALVVFIRGTDNAIWHQWQDVNGAWSGWSSLGGTLTSDPDATLTLDGRLVVFARGTENAIWQRAQLASSGGWSDWEKVGSDNDSVGGPSAVTMANGEIAVFIRGTDNAIWHQWQVFGSWPGWVSLQAPGAASEIFVHSRIPGFDGWAEVRLRDDGTVRFAGRLRNDRVEGIRFRIRALMRSGSIGVALVHEGSAAGSLGGDARFADWVYEDTHTLSRVAFERLRGAQLQVSADVEGAITGFLEDIGVFVVRWVVGGVLLQSGLLFLIPMGVIAGSLISTGGFAGGARLIGGTLWLVGPGGILVALVAEGIAAVASNEREMSPEEYDRAKEEVFGRTLPPRERIVFTDAGGDGRAFVFPRFDGKITVNFGPNEFANPLTSDRALFFHELTHVWQLQNTHTDLEFIGDGLGARICEIGTPASILYEPGDGSRPFRELNIEQQGTAVERFASQPSDRRYDRYIRENIRTGMA